jgi:hypothetical protein
MSRLCFVLPLLSLLAGCLGPNSPMPNTDASVSFTDAEKVHGVALARQYVEKQGIAPKDAVYRLDEVMAPADVGGDRSSRRQMVVTVEFKDRQPWRLLVMPDGTLKRTDEAQADNSVAAKPS